MSDRLKAARTAGFDAVEHPEPFALPARELRTRLDDLGLALVQITSGTGGTGEKGIAARRGRETEFRESFARALDYAETAGAPLLHAMAGTGGDAATYRANLEAAIRLCEGRPVMVLIEAISDAAVPGYHLADPDALLSIGREMPELRLLVDSFHAASCGADPAAVVRAAGTQLGHVHLADHPGRAEPGSGALDFAAILAALDETGYRGAIGFEYLPSGPDHLNWQPRLAAEPALRALQRKG